MPEKADTPMEDSLGTQPEVPRGRMELPTPPPPPSPEKPGLPALSATEKSRLPTPPTPENPKDILPQEASHSSMHESKISLFMAQVARNYFYRQLKASHPHLQPTPEDTADERAIYLETPRIWINEHMPHSPVSEVASVLGRDLREASLKVMDDKSHTVLKSYLVELGRLTVTKWWDEGRWPAWRLEWNELLKVMWYVIFEPEKKVQGCQSAGMEELKEREPELLGDELMEDLEWERACDMLQEERGL